MRRTKIILYLSLVTQVLSMQSQEFSWATHVSGDNHEHGIKTVQDPLGNTYIIGYTNGRPFEYNGISYATNGDGDAFFAKLDINKELIWMKSVGGNDLVYYDEAVDIHIDPFDDIYLTFQSKGNNFVYDGQVLSGINSPGQVGGEGVLLKVNANGNYIWHDSGTRASRFQGITTDTNGNLYLTGYFRSTITLGGEITLTNPSSGTTRDLLLAKYQPDGTILWAKHAGGTPHNTFASGGDVEIHPISNEVIVLGRGNGAVYFDGIPMPVIGDSDEGTVLISYNQDGTQNWLERVMDEENYGYAPSTSLAISPSGIIGICGYTYSDGLVGFYTSDGSVISKHQYPSTDELKLYSITFNEHNEAYISGWCSTGAILGMSPGTATISKTTGFIVKIDTLQQVEWVSEFESSRFRNQITYNNSKLLYAGRFDNKFIYNAGQNIIINNAGDALFGEVTDNSLAVETYFKDNVILHPNPTSGLFIVQADNLQQVKVYNINGVLIHSTEKNKIDLSQYSKGIYLVKITTNNGSILKRIILK